MTKLNDLILAQLPEKLKGWFEANHLDGDDVNDCGGCTFSAPQVLEVLQEFSDDFRSKLESLDLSDWVEIKKS